MPEDDDPLTLEEVWKEAHAAGYREGWNAARAIVIGALAAKPQTEDMFRSLDQPISSIDLETRTKHVFYRAFGKDATISEIRNQTARNLLSLTNFGLVSFRRLIGAFERYGIPVKDDWYAAAAKKYF